VTGNGRGPGEIFQELRAALRDSRPVALATVTGVTEGADVALGAEVADQETSVAQGTAVTLGSKLLVSPGASGPDSHGVLGSLGDGDLDRVVTRDAVAAVAAGQTVTRHYGPHGEARQAEVEVMIEVFAPPPRMIVFGAVDFTAALAANAKLLGYYVVVCDARAIFATEQRFPMADEVVVDWPDRYLERYGGDLTGRDAICVLTHDTKFDVPAILAALRTEVGYLGAMGSRRTHDERWQRLLTAGADVGELHARLMSPIGLDIGARTPEETAVAICAEIIACRVGIAVPSLSLGEGPIHRR
jgi:xanthine dehydrogenase accessory factor